MRTIALNDILIGIGALPVDDAAKNQFRKLIASIGRIHAVRGLEYGERLAFIRQLLDSGEHRTVIRNRVSARYAISERQALRYISKALSLRHK